MIADIASYLKANRFGHNLEKAITYYAFFGEMSHLINDRLSLIDNIRSIFSNPQTLHEITPTFCGDARMKKYNDIKQEDIHHLLSLLCRGDRRYKGTIHRAYEQYNIPIPQSHKILSYLMAQKVLVKEATQEVPLVKDKHHKLKKSMRHYFIDDKLKFSSPFMRFFYTFVFDHFSQIERGNLDHFIDHIESSFYSFVSFCFEDVAVYLLNKGLIFDEVTHAGSFWGKGVEVDILAHTKNLKVIIGECKWKNRKIGFNDVNKLMAKVKRIPFEVEGYLFFSKSGFSEKLKKSQRDDIFLLSLDDIYEGVFKASQK